MQKHVAKTEGTGKREEIIRHAFTVFYKDGFHAAGVDRVLQGTGISKRTLYKYFASKEALIEATLEHYRDNSVRAFGDFVANAQATQPLARALLVFDWLEAIVKSGHTLGCFAINAKMEYANRDAVIEACCDKHFAKLEELVADLTRQAGCKAPANVAHQLMMLFQGAIVKTRGAKQVESIYAAKAAAQILLQASTT